MNYRHAFHAGNFADVLKHAVLARIVLYLQRKEKAFRVIDTHAGPGRCDLLSPDPERTGEWRRGIARLIEQPLPAEAAALLTPYLDTVRAENPDGGLRFYPGSPLLVRRLLRPQDRLTAIELHTDDAASLKELFAGDIQTRVIALDGWLALGSQLPPKEKRGLVLVDPPFEQAEDWDRLVSGLSRAHRRWPGGIYALWYPVKDRAAVARFRDNLAGSSIPRILDVRLETGLPAEDGRLAGCALAVINPPFSLEAELGVLLPALRERLAEGPGAASDAVWLAGERPAHRHGGDGEA